jgi:hypothetical protein
LAQAEKAAADKSEAPLAGSFQKGMLKQLDARLDDLRKKEPTDPKPAAAAPKGAKDSLAADNLENAEGKDRQKAQSSQLLFAPDLAADAKGQVQLGVQLPREPGNYWLIVDAYGAGGTGQLQKRLLIRVPPAAKAAAPAASATEAKPSK